MTPLEKQIQTRIEQSSSPLLTEKEKWAVRFGVGAAIYVALGGREVRAIVGAGAVYYLVQKKVIQGRIDELKQKMFGKENT